MNNGYVGFIGSINGTVNAGTNLIDTIREKEKERAKKGLGYSREFAIRRLAINGKAGTKFTLNGASITLSNTGIFEIGAEMCHIESLVFNDSIEACIVYIF